MPAAAATIEILDLGRIDYASAYTLQESHAARVFAERGSAAPSLGTLLLLEHDPPVITISRRQGARANLLATDEHLARHGIAIAPTDRGGDITYHGPGQLVAYPILDLNALGLGIHAYMRLLEDIVIDVCASFAVAAARDACATGVWLSDGPAPAEPGACAPGSRKICAMGVRIRKWVSMHGLALNVTTNLDHFGLIIPCGLAGRGVTSLERELGAACPTMEAVKDRLGAAFAAHLDSIIRRRAARNADEPAAPR